MPRTRVREIFNGTINNAGSTQVDNFPVDGADLLTVWWQMQGTVTPSDMTPYVCVAKADGTYAANGSFPAYLQTANVSDGANLHSIKQYDVRGIGRISIRALNNGAAPHTTIITVYLGGES